MVIRESPPMQRAGDAGDAGDVRSSSLSSPPPSPPASLPASPPRSYAAPLSGKIDKSHLKGQPGLLAQRFLRDFLDGNVIQDVLSLAGLSAHGDTPHMFLVRDDSTSHWHAALYCPKCALHYFVHAKGNVPPPPGDRSHRPCGPTNPKYRVHHLVRSEIVYGFDQCSQRSQFYHEKYNPVTVMVMYACTAPKCAFSLTIEISPRRLPVRLTKTLMCQEEIEARKAQVVAEGLLDAEAAAPWATKGKIVHTLNRILSDLCARGLHEKLRRFDVNRNPKFQIVFGATNDDLLRYLELQHARGETVDQDSNEVPWYWTFPPPAPKEESFMLDGKTAKVVGNQTAFYLECRMEILALYNDENNPGGEGQWEACHKGYLTVLKSILNIGQIDNRRAGGSANDHDKNPAYVNLGVLRSDTSDMLVFALESQMQNCPNRKGEFIQSLIAVSNLRADNDLQLTAATIQSLVEAPGDTPVDQAYKYLASGTDPALTKKQNDAFMISQFKVRVDASPTDMDTALEMLLIIGNDRQSVEIRNFVWGERKRLSTSMSVDDAFKVLEFPDVTQENKEDQEMVVSIAVANARESTKARPTLARALRALGNHYDNDHRLVAMAEELNPQPIQDVMAMSKPDNDVDPTIPLGLYNIGNTCYLNSILQYLYTVKPVREILGDFDAHKLDLANESVGERRIGGNKTRLERYEAVAAQQFVHELSLLFNDLGHCPGTYIRPPQRLANGALLSVGQLLSNAKKDKDKERDREQNKGKEMPPGFIGPMMPSSSPVPPELPPRPAAPVAGMQPLPPPLPKDVEMTDVGYAPKVLGTSDQETASRSSAQTLVNEVVPPAQDATDGDQDVVMEDPVSTTRPHVETASRPATPSTAKPDDEPDVEALIRKALDNSDRSGTTQQDVEEVMGNVMLRLQESIKTTATGTLDGKTQIQLDQIMETFYCVLVNYTAKAEGDGTLEEIAHERWITAYPAEKGRITMYEALDRTFDKQFLDGTQRPRYTVIRHLPPIVHICIQRTTANGNKNLNMVDLPHTLYLDRYMEDEDGELAKLRDRSWGCKLRLGQLKKGAADHTSDEEVIRGNVALDKSNSSQEKLSSMLYGKESAEDSDPKSVGSLDLPTLDSETATLNPDDPPTPPLEPTMTHADEVKTREEELESLWTGRDKMAYNLHAVICHGGLKAGFGHYWVFVYDFPNACWVKFNDDTVTRHTDEEFQRLISAQDSTPYYVAYVEAAKEPSLVDMPPRKSRALPTAPSAASDAGSQSMPDLIPSLNTDADKSGVTIETIEGLNGNPHPGKRNPSPEIEMGGMGNDGEPPSYQESIEDGTCDPVNLGNEMNYSYMITPTAPPGLPRGPSPVRPTSANPKLAEQFRDGDGGDGSPSTRN